VKITDEVKNYVRQISAKAQMNPELFIAEPKELFESQARKLTAHLKICWQKIISTGEPQRIIIHGDYDVDGVSSAAILSKVLKQVLPQAEIEVFLPRRSSGYGITEDSIARFNEYQPDLIITADCGTNDRLLHEHARSNPELRYLVIDHHLISDEELWESRPENLCIVNGHNFKDIELCAAGMCFCFALALLGEGAYEDDLIGYGSLATVADLTPLNNPANFAITKLGLNYLNKRQPSWAVHLNQGPKFQAYSFGFIIGPRINAISRIGESPNIAYRALMGDVDAINILHKANSQRQVEVEKVCKSVMPAILDNPSPVIFVEVDTLPGYVGLIASRLVELFNRPALVACPTGENSFSGSARSVEGVHLVNDVLEKAKDLFTRYGGHEMAAGFSYSGENSQAIAQVLSGLTDLKLEPAELDALEVDLDSAHIYGAAVANFITEPHGNGNPSPVFCVSNATIDRITPVKNGAYTAFRIEDDKGNFARMMCWNKFDTVASLLASWDRKMPVTVYFSAKYDPNNHQFPISLVIQEIRQGDLIFNKKSLELYELENIEDRSK